MGRPQPLLEAEFSKADIREVAKELGLSNWEKPAAACLSSRVPRGITITRAILSRVERAEAGPGQRRLPPIPRTGSWRHCQDRTRNGRAAGLDPCPGRRERLAAALKQAGYRFVTLDLEGYRQGGVSLTSPA